MTTSLNALIEQIQAQKGPLNEQDNAPPTWQHWAKACAFQDIPLQQSDVLQRHEMALHLALQWQKICHQRVRSTPAFVDAMQAFWWAAAHTLLRDWVVFQSLRHPVTFVAEQLFLWGRAWDEVSAQRTPELLNRLRRRCDAVAEAAFTGQDKLLEALKQLHGEVQEFLAEQRNADRDALREAEKKRRSTNCQAAVTRVIRRCIYGRPVPALIVDFVDKQWRRYLYQVYLQHGMEHPAWQQAVRDIEELVWLGGEAFPEEIIEQKETRYVPLRTRLEKGLSQLRREETDESFLTDLDYLMHARAINAPDAGLPLGELSYAEDETDTLHGDDKPDHSWQALAVGQNLILVLPEGERRFRIIEIDQINASLLLSDITGLHTTMLTRDQFISLVARDAVTFIAELHILQQASDHLRPELETILHAIQKQKKENEIAKQKEKEAQLAVQLEERRKQEATWRAEKLSQAKAEAEQAQIKAEEEQRKQASIRRIEQLRSGAMLSLSLNKGAARVCYLALINVQTGLYVFVDRQGQRIAELSKMQLADLLHSGQLTVLESGSALNNSSMTNLVRERREFLKDQGES